MDVIANPTSQDKSIAQKAADYLLQVFDEKQDNRLVFHNYHLASSCAERIAEIQGDLHLPDRVVEIAQIVCWFLPVGYLFDYQAPLNYSLRELGRFFGQHPYPEKARKQVVHCLQHIAHRRQPVTPEEKLVSDARSISGWLTDFPARMELLRMEKTLMTGEEVSDVEWLQYQYQFLMEMRLYSPIARTEYQAQLSRELLQLQKEINKYSGAKEKERYKLEKKVPSRGAQTFFRTNFRNHINLSAIADRKSRIMISVNAIMISVLITFMRYQNMA
jgi:hypothetical protein